MKSKIFTTGIIIATVILAAVAIFTAYRLYQLRSESVAPTAADAASTAPHAVTSSVPCETLSFAILEKEISLLEEEFIALADAPETTATPTNTPTSTPTPTTSPTPTDTETTATLTPTNTHIGGETAGTTTLESELPEAGVGAPTIFAASAGLLFLILSFALVL